MANWFNIAGGAGQGYVQGDQDNQRRQEFLSMQRQRQRIEQQQKTDDELAKTLKQVRPAGDYTDYVPTDPTEAAPGFMGPPSATKEVKTKRTAADVAREQANVYSTKGGRLQDLQAAAGLQQQAYAAAAADRQEKAAQGFETLSQAEAMLNRGDHVGAARLLQQGYAKYPDGHDIVFEMKNGVMHSGVAAGGKYIEPPQPVTPQSVKGMIDKGYAMLSPEARMAERKYGLEARTVGAQEMSAAAAQQNAQSAYQKVLHETGDEAKALMAAQEEMYRAHAAYYRAGGAGGGAGGTAYGTPIPMLDDKGQMTYGIPTKKGPGEPSITPISMPPGWTFQKPPPVMNDVQKSAHAALMKMDAEGAFDGKGGRAKRDAFIMSNKLDQFVDVDPMTKALLAAGPPKETAGKPGAAPAAPAAPAEDKTRYNRSRTPRGWDYSLTTRGGKTKAEWAAEDAKASGK